MTLKISQNMYNHIILKVRKLHSTTMWWFVATIDFESVGNLAPLVKIGLKDVSYLKLIYQFPIGKFIC